MAAGEELAQLRLLTRHFFTRLFRNDVVDFEDQMKARLIAVLAVLAVIMGWSSYMLIFFRYELSPDAGTSWQEKNYIFILMMIMFGIVTLLEWEMLFPDRRDFVNLTPLPVRLRTVFAAKLASFVAFIGLFSAAMNSLSSASFAFFLAQWRSDSLLFLARYVGAHLVSAFAACFCVFFACVFVNFFLMAVLPAGLYRRASALVRFVLVGSFIFLLLSFLADPGGSSGAIRSLARLKDHGSPIVSRIPSMWFVGLYEVLLGTSDPSFIALARKAGLALGLSLGAFGLACALSYLRHFGKTLEAAKKRLRPGGLRSGVGNALWKALFRKPEERAVAAFFTKTLRASPRHRTVLVNSLAAGAALATLSIVANRRNLQALAPGNAFFLAQSLLLVLVLLAGLRAVVDVPAALESNWIFRVTETAERSRYVSGLKKAVFFQWLLPLSALLFAAHLWLWRDGRAASLHAVFCLALSALGVEAFFFRYRKVPFASTFVPGKLRLQTRGMLYVAGLLALLAALAAVEKALLAHPGSFGAFIPASAALWAVLRIDSARFLRDHPLIYEEEPEPALVGFPEGG
ncbi:MAG TPA: hypothetical protein P5119_08720 [Candidatus Aminicenantes bacterium]|nr:hypothetical protein [Candidatus Aminicenantes bacterium]HRY65408.1 hypothetical protein [Candidatus Aminicenantes bacterium]HRZ72124.1 hypothetical protein [Candidatus Aminicenantes bacterium]